MVTTSSIRTKLLNKIFTPYGKSVTLNSATAITYNSRGEEENRSSTSSTITIVPYNIVYNRRSYESFGDLRSGDFDLAVPYSVTIAVGDTITMDAVNYVVTQVEQNLLPDNVVTIARVTKVVA